jgi:hypothetical protein
MQMNCRITSINRVRNGRAKLGSFALLAIYLFLSTGCTRLASVKHTPARYASSGTREHELAIAERELTDASKIEYRQPLLALASDLAAAKIAVNTLEYRRDNTDAQKLYNFAVARSVENIQRAHLQPWRRAINVLRPNREFILTTPRPIDSEHDPSNYTLFLCDSLSLGGKFFKTRSSLEGIVAPLVAVERGENTQFRQSYELPRVYAPVTAVVKFQGRRAQLEFIEPFVSDRVKIDNHSFLLAADYDAPMRCF